MSCSAASVALTTPKSRENSDENTREMATVDVMNGRKYAPTTEFRHRPKAVCRKKASGSATRCCGRPETRASHTVL